MYRNLIFFVCLLVLACSEKPTELKIIWTAEHATAIYLPHGFIKEDVGLPQQSIVVRLEGDSIAMLGNFKRENDAVIFEPLIPFTRGSSYEVLVNGSRVAEMKIPEANEGAPELLAIYPTQDTVPENLLKVYLHFSKPMRSGVSAQYITLLQNEKDTTRSVFLNLQPELWNEDHTTLTLWLDPGRIKRDLIPNKLLGTPLRKGNPYSLVIADTWQDTQGVALKKSYRKEFFVEARDSISPAVQQWLLNTVTAGAASPLLINFNSSLDYSLMMSCFHLENEKGEVVSGKWEAGEEEKKIKFIPDNSWSPGNYVLSIETRLEDLAGNNLNRLFDTDVSKKHNEISSRETVSLHFEVLLGHRLGLIL